ncbi:hypothetical protein ONZ45_g4508 [Pleurotus djamor]|nr:hypothetical protein ONZ45_g4508 [Pleurotus djamor]
MPPEATFFTQAIIISIAHSLYILRIWRLATLNGFRRPALLTTILTVFSASSLDASYQLSLVSQLDGFQHLPAVVYSCLASTCVADFSISIVLIMLLIRRPKATSWFAHLTAFDIDSAVIQYGLKQDRFNRRRAHIVCPKHCVFSVASIVAYATRRSSYAFMGIRIILSTVHINSLMAMLNARRYFQKETPSTVVLQAHDAFLTFSKGGTIEASRRRPTTADRDAQPTINEAGFPQFGQATRTPCDVVEVVVAQERSTTVSRATHL